MALGAAEASYGAVLRRPGVRTALVAYSLARLSATMTMLSLLLFIQHRSGSFATAGAITAAFAGANAVVSPLLGRVVDRRGQWPVLATTAVLQPLALLSVVLLIINHENLWAVLGAVASGATLPPVTSCMRALWPALIDDDELMPRAWLIDGLIVEATELLGPLVAGLLVLLVKPYVAVLVAAGLSYTGAMVFGLSMASVAWSRNNAGGERAAGRSPLASAGVRALLAVVLLSTAGLAALEVAVAAFASGHGSPGSSGILLAVWLSGSLLGGYLYGSRAGEDTTGTRLPLLLAISGATMLLPALAVGFLSMGGLLLVAGLAIAPAAALQFAAMSRVAPDGRRTEAFTFAATASFLGVGLGSSLGGAAVEHVGTSFGVTLAAACTGLAALTALLGRRWLTGGAIVVPSQPTASPFESVLVDAAG